MAKILQARDALGMAKGATAGLDALAALLASASEGDAPPMKDLGEIVGALHFQLRDHLATVERCLDD